LDLRKVRKGLTIVEDGRHRIFHPALPLRSHPLLLYFIDVVCPLWSLLLLFPLLLEGEEEATAGTEAGAGYGG